MALTKEEILKSANGFFYLEDFVYHEESVKEAMDIHAKNTAIEFRKYCNSRKIGDTIERNLYTHEQLYELYLISK